VLHICRTDRVAEYINVELNQFEGAGYGPETR
jgi:hypothetical protein